MSDVENLDVILGSYSRNKLESNSEDRNIEVDLGSDVVQNSEDFRTLLNSNISETTSETVRLVNTEVSRRLQGLKRYLNFQIIESINSAINEKIFKTLWDVKCPHFGKMWTIGPVDISGPPKLNVIEFQFNFVREHGTITLE